MKWLRKYPQFASFEVGSKKPEHFYESLTELGMFTLLRRNALKRGGRPLKYKVWVLYVNGKPVSGSRCYRLMDAKAFAEEHLAELHEQQERRNKLKEKKCN